MTTPLDGLVERFGEAAHPERPPAHRRPDGLDDATVEALGKLGAALETAEEARGHLYAFHRTSGRADLDLQDALDALAEAGHREVADTVRRVLVGRDTVKDMWSFQMVESYDADYLEAFRACEQAARAALGDVPVHLYEAEMKHREQAGH